MSVVILLEWFTVCCVFFLYNLIVLLPVCSSKSCCNSDYPILIKILGPASEKAIALPDEELSKTVEEVLNLADKNNDGYISYLEYKRLSH